MAPRAREWDPRACDGVLAKAKAKKLADKENGLVEKDKELEDTTRGWWPWWTFSHPFLPPPP
jgi:hypothetical protein